MIPNAMIPKAMIPKGLIPKGLPGLDLCAGTGDRRAISG
jgi:hypothetical protein